MLRNITKSIKNYAQGRKGWKSRLDAIHELNDQQTPTPNRQYKVKKALKRVFRSASQKSSRGGTIPIIVEQSSEIHYSPPIFQRARLEAQARQTPGFTITPQHDLPAHFIDEALDRSIAALRGDVSFVDSGYGIDLVSYERDLASSTGAYIEECGPFLDGDANPAFLTGAGNDERGLFLPVADEMIAIVSDGEVDGDSSRPLEWNQMDDSGVLPSGSVFEQGSSRNSTSTSWNDDVPGLALERPQELEPKFVEEQDLHTFSFHVNGSGWKTNNGPLSPELSPMSMDFPALNSLPFEPSMNLPHYQIHDEQVPQGDLLYSEPPMTGTRSAPSQKGAAIDWSLLLPTELLQEIFFHVLPNQIPLTDWKLDTPWPRPNHGAALLDLRRVCRRWNDATLSPCVWNLNTVAWSVATSTKPDSRARLGCIELHSRWAHSAPVDAISYEIGNELMTLVSDEIMDAVYQSIVNCRFVRIVLPERDIVDTDLIQLYPDCAQEMSRLRVLSWTSPYSIDTVLPSRWRLPWTSLRQAPWKQLTAVFLDCPLAMEDCISILTQYPMLETVDFGNINSSTVNTNDNTLGIPVNYTLSSLKITSAVDVDILFSHVRLQSITYLHLQLIYNIQEASLKDLNIPWVSLETLILNCALELTDAYQLFRQCQSLTKLEWHWPDDIESDLSTNLLTRREPLNLSNLKTLTITPTLSGHHVQSLLEALIGCMQSAIHLTLPSIPKLILRMFPSGSFAHLETVTLTNPISAQECLSIIGLSNQLRRLDVLVQDGNLNPDDWPNRLVHPTLQHLSLRTPVKNLEHLFDKLTLPSLMGFEMRYKENEYSQYHWAGDHRHGYHQRGLCSFIRRSRSAVRLGHPMSDLVLDGITIQRAALERIIQEETSLETNIYINHVMVFDPTPTTTEGLAPFVSVRAPTGHVRCSSSQ